MEGLKRRRGVIKGQLTRFKSYYSKINLNEISEDDISELNERVEKFQPCWAEFNELQSQIEEAAESTEVEASEREKFENSYFRLMANVKVLLNKAKSDSSNDLSRNAAEVNYRRGAVKLPVIKIETFDGQYLNWLGFKDSFEALINSDPQIHKIQKFLYLRSSVQGEAAEAIQAIELSADNYDVAYQILKERYEKKSLIIHNHIKALFDCPSMQREAFGELRKVFDTFNKHLRSLKTLGENVDSWDRIIIYMLCSKFDSTTARDWESYKIETELPCMNDMNNFLKEKCEILEKVENNKTEKQKIHNNKKSISNSFHNSNNNNFKLVCFYCKGEHAVYKCDEFCKLAVEERIAAVKKHKLCMICFRDTHFSWKCKVAKKCFKCDKAHNTLLHINERPSEPATVTLVSAGKGEESEAGAISVNNFSEMAVSVSQVLLATAIIKIRVEGKSVNCRALLDSGSQSHFIKESLFKKLNLPETRIKHLVKGVGQTLTNINKKVNITFMSCYNDFNMNIDCLILPKITERLPMVSFDKTKLNIPDGIKLADPTFNLSNEIDVLLGSHVFWSIMQGGQIKLGKNLPTLQETNLGWLIAGNRGDSSTCNVTTNHVSIAPSDQFIDNELTKFWELEEVESKDKLMLMSPDERYCEKHFAETTKRDNKGRFIVNIPFKESVHNLGESREMAIKRFYQLERKLKRDGELKKEYVMFMKDYNNDGHMRETNNSEAQREGYYIPHHAVIKSTSITTKCRVVFDASAKTDSGLSLNDVQFNGPSLQRDIFTILIRFRKFKLVMTADIKKMYRQILIDESQRIFQKIFWREEENEKLKCYKLNTVTYGTASAAYLAIRALVQVAIKNKKSYPVASKVIEEDFYVDDLLTGADTEEDLLQIQRDVTKLLAESGFELRKWLCNDQGVLNKFEVNNKLEASVLHIGTNEQNKTLARWVFDPLGLLGPVIITAKLLIQELWKEKGGWDDPIAEDLKNKWIEFQGELAILNEIKLPRHIVSRDNIEIQLHGFCDASEKAYGACMYVRCRNSDGTFATQLVCAKSRVAPLKNVSLPRLELCGAVLLAKLTKRVVDSLEIDFKGMFLWTDSTVTLAWIKGAPNKWKTFVANRVSEIQSLTNENNWYHIRSSDNPADLLSRGVSSTAIGQSKLWWHGPPWLNERESEWNLNNIVELGNEIPEQRSVSNVACVQENRITELIDNHSSIIKVKRILAYVLRFMNNAKGPKEVRKLGSLSVSELEASLKKLIKGVQSEFFAVEYKNLSAKRDISKSSKLLALNPFIHNELIRVGGRLSNSRFSFDKKYPIILPQGVNLTRLILEEEHKRLLHCGAHLLLSSVRERYWPISGRNACKGIVRKCVVCTKAKPSELKYLMGNLPDVRVANNLPFENVGIDYGGPFLLKDRKTRGPKLIKAYICLFVCMCTKAVHLELVSELSTKAFLDTLKRFVSRRGKPANIYSDNGSNFAGANNELKRIHEFLQIETKHITDELSMQGVNWHFIPARSPNFGGLWEAGIKSTKSHLKRVIGSQTMTFEDFNTVLVQIEGVLNSRPLCPLSPDPNDLTALTPGHFLIGRTITAIPEVDITNVEENRLDKYQRLQAMVQHYWTRWSKEYVSELQVRSKWKQNFSQLLRIDSMVLVKEGNAHSQEWCLGRVIKLHPGDDGIVRVVEVRVRSGVMKRAVSKICVLPIE